MKKRIVAVLFAFLLISSFGADIRAEDEYDITVDGGLYGEAVLNAASSKIATGSELTFVFDAQEPLYKGYVVDENGEKVYTITVDQSITVGEGEDERPKYYLKSLHYSGIYDDEDGDGMNDPVVTIDVTQDLVLVASYGIANDLVPYTVTYVDGSGNELLPPDTFYAKDGEKVKVAARFVDGYIVKNTKAFTGTVHKDGDPVSFEFVYRRVTSGPGEETETVYIIEEEGPGTGGGGGGTSPSVPEEPADIIDIDDNPIPQTDPPTPEPIPEPEPEPEPEPISQMTIWQYLIAHPWLLGLLVFGLGFLIWLIITLITRRKREDA